MGKIRQININNRTYYFNNDQIDLKDFDVKLLKDCWLCDGLKIANCDNINSVNHLYLMINEMIGHFEEKNGNKCLVFR